MSLQGSLEQHQIRDRLFDIGWILLLTALVLNLTAWCGTDYSGHMMQVLKLMRFAAAGLFLVVILLNLFFRLYKGRWIALYAVMLVVFGLSWYFSKDTTLFFYFFVFAAAYRQDSRRIVTLAAIINGTLLAVNLVGSGLGFCVNFLFGEGERPRYGLGYSWATSSAILFLFFLLEYICLRREKMHWWEYLVFEAVSIFLFLMTDSRMAFVMSTVVLVFFFADGLKKKQWKILYQAKWLAVILPALLAMAALALCFLYKPATPGWSEFDDFLSNRLYLGNKAIRAYDITLFGSEIKWIGYDINNLEGIGYNYVDCSYLQILLQFGAVPLFFCVFLYCAGVWRAIKARDGFAACIFIIVGIFSMTEPRYMNLAFNVFPVLVFTTLNCHPACYKTGSLKEIFTFHVFHPQERHRAAEPVSEDDAFRTPSIRLNFIMNVLLSVSSFVFPLITFPYVSRVLGPYGTGSVDFAVSIVGYFCIFAQLGIPTYGIRAIAKVRDDKAELSKTAQELLIINLLATAVSYILLFIAIFTVPQMKEEKTLFVIVSLMLVLSAIGMEWLYKGLEQYRYITVRTLLFKAIAAVAMFLLVRSEDQYLIYGCISIFSGYASCILNFLHARKLISFRKEGKYNFRRHLKPAVLFFALACATTVYTHLDAGMLGFMKGKTEVGYYNAAVKVKTILLGLITSLGAVLLPRASYYLDKGMKKEFEHLGKRALNFTVLMAAPVFIYFILFAKEGIMSLSGQAFAGSIVPMQIIMPTVLLIGITNILGFQILTPMDRENVVFRSVCAGAVLDIILNILLIPPLGPSGAAIGTLAAEAAVLVYQLAALRKIAGALFSEIKIVKITIAILVGCVLTLWMKILPFSDLVLIILSAAVFFGAYYAVLMILKEPLVKELSSQVGSRLKRYTGRK